MIRNTAAFALVATLALPALAEAGPRHGMPDVRVPATVSGTWVLDPFACPDLREDIRDSRVTYDRRDRREDRRDRRIIDCPASAFTFVPDAGQAPDRPIRVRRDGSAKFVGDRWLERHRREQVSVQPYAQPQPYTPPTYTAPYQPTYQPTYTQPSYTYSQPTYSAPAQTSRYEIRNGQIVWLD